MWCCAAVILSGINTGGGAQEPNLSTYRSFGEPGARVLVPGDLDGDGMPDIAALHTWDDTVDVLVGDGAGRLVSAQLVATGPTPVAGVIGDVDGDGAADLVVALREAGELVVLPGDGAGGLLPGNSVPTVAAPDSVARGDFDGDGDADLAVGSAESTAVWIHWSDGAGVFTVSDSVLMGGTVRTIDAADLDGDGTVELIVGVGLSGGASGELARVDFDGAGVAVTEVIASTSAGPPVEVALADLDGNGLPDVIAAATRDVPDFESPHRPESQLIAVRLLGFSALPPVEMDVEPDDPSFAYRIEHLAVGDGDGDGEIDLLVSGNTWHESWWSPGSWDPGDDWTLRFRGLGSGAFTSRTVLTGEYFWARDFAWVDLDVDGPAEFILAMDRVWVARTDCDGLPEHPASTASLAAPEHLASVDLDGDGSLDLLFAAEVLYGDLISPEIHTYLSSGDGGLTFAGIAGLGLVTHDLVAADFDGDGFGDVLMSTGWAMPYEFEIRTGDGTGGLLDSVTVGTHSAPATLATGDYDLDGFADVLSVQEDSTQVLWGDGDGTFTVSLPIFTAGTDAALIADVDGDGAADLVTAAGTQLAVRLGDGARGFGTPIFTPGLLGDTQQLAAADFDGDGALDIATENEILIGTGAGGFAVTPQGHPGSGLRAADLDADGFVDLLSADGGDVALLLGHGDGTFDEAERFGVTSTLSVFSVGLQLAMGDFDSDGALDVYCGNGSQLLFLRNRSLDSPDPDCDGDGVPDRCAPDCDGDGVPDLCEILAGTALDSDGDGVPDSCELFLRGDANGDGVLDLGDPVASLDHLFSGAPAACPAAHDTNGDDALDLADPISTLSYLFSGGPPPAAPFPLCGYHAAGSSLFCSSPSICP